MEYKALQEATDQDVAAIVSKLQSAGYETYIVGGAVRDLLLGIKPKDYDIASSATPEQIKSIFRRNCRIIGKRFKLVHHFANGRITEISTFRKEPPENEKFILVKGKLRLNENSYGSAYEDAWRRDFTVNAIFFNPSDGSVLDHTGMGREDLKKRIVRTIGDANKRFEEDPVRILRALKLAGQYSFSIEENTLCALHRKKELIKTASISRLTLELEKILKNANSAKIISAFIDYDFLSLLLPNLNKEIRENEQKKNLMLEILSEWNLRISQGLYRPSISITLAAFLIPFCAEIICIDGINPTVRSRWEIAGELNEKIRYLMRPYNFSRKLLAISAEIMMMQALMLKQEKNKRLIRHNRFMHAKELFQILAKTYWKDEKLLQKWQKN